MATTSTTASEVMDMAAALLNDQARSIYTYATQLPYVNIAGRELEEWCELNNIPSTSQTSAVIEVEAGENRIVPVTDPAMLYPTYPSDLVEIQQIWSRATGTDQEYTPLTKFEYIPHWWETQPATSNLECWAWLNQEIRFGEYGATIDNDVKIDYIKTLFPQTLTENSTIGIINSLSFLGYRTASLIAQYIGENESRAGELRAQADVALDRLLGIGIKGKQSISIRRRPFMASYKNRTMDW